MQKCQKLPQISTLNWKGEILGMLTWIQVISLKRTPPERKDVLKVEA